MDTSSITGVKRPRQSSPELSGDGLAVDGAAISSLNSRIGDFITAAKTSSTAFSPLESASLLMLEACSQILSRLSSTPSPDSLHDHIREERRERSVVIEFLPEDMTLAGAERVKRDSEAVQQILSHAGLEIGGPTHFRMGKPGQKTADGKAKPRLLKLELPGRSFKHILLSKASLVRKDPNFKGVFIRPSLSAEQRKADYLLREKKREMVRQGKDMVIFRGQLLSRVEADRQRSTRPFSDVNQTPLGQRSFAAVAAQGTQPN